MSHRRPHPDARARGWKRGPEGFSKPERKRRRRNPDGAKPHGGELRGGRPYFVTEKRKRPKLSKWLDPDLRCH